MWNLKRNDTNELTYKTERDSQTQKISLLVRGGGTFREFGKVMYTILYSKWITNKDLLYSTWNSTQSFRASLDGRGLWGRMDTCICTAESLQGSPESTEHCLLALPIYKIRSLKHSNNKNIHTQKKLMGNPLPTVTMGK